MNSYRVNPEDVIQLIIGGIAMLVWLGIFIFVCWHLARCLRRVPGEFRLMEPAQVWLLLIPCFNIVWMFFVFTRIPRSFQAYFDSIDDDSVGDCGYQIGLWHCITSLLGCIPIVYCAAGPACLILLIVFLIRMNDLRKRVEEAEEEEFAVAES